MTLALPPSSDGAAQMRSAGLGRRAFAAALATLVGGTRGVSARPAAASFPFEDGATLLVAGTEQGHLNQVADLITPALGRGLPAGTGLRRQLTGGDDGVAGANQFGTRATPDGQTVLLLPGEAALAWLAGDPRAQFDPTRWVTIMAGWTPGLVMSRVPLAALSDGTPLRIAAADPVGADLPALLALDLLRIDAAPLFRVSGFEAARAALDAQAVDAVFLHAEGVPQQAASLVEAGLAPLFSLGMPDAAGGAARDPLFPDVPSVPERIGAGLASTPLFSAWRAAAAAAQVDFALMLPQLTPAAMVALWRRAGAGVPAAPELQLAAEAGLRAVAAPAATTAPLAPDAVALLELRRWLADRYNWQPA